MPKPICIIYFPENFVAGGSDRSWIYEYMAFLNGDTENAKRHYGKNIGYYKDYYWFCFYDPEIEKIELKVFYEKDFTDIQYEELKQLILNSIEENKQKSK